MHWDCPVAGAGTPGSEGPQIFLLAAFTIDISRFELHFHVALFGFAQETVFRDTFGMVVTN